MPGSSRSWFPRTPGRRRRGGCRRVLRQTRRLRAVDDQRRWMARARHVHPATLGIDDAVQHRRRRPAGGFRAKPFIRSRATEGRRPSTAYTRRAFWSRAIFAAACRPLPTTSPIATPARPSRSAIRSYQSPPTWASVRARQVAGRRRQPGDLRKAFRQQAPLKGLGDRRHVAHLSRARIQTLQRCADQRLAATPPFRRLRSRCARFDRQGTSLTRRVPVPADFDDRRCAHGGRPLVIPSRSSSTRAPARGPPRRRALRTRRAPHSGASLHTDPISFTGASFPGRGRSCR